MCGTNFWQMENSLLMSLTALLLLGFREGIANPNNLNDSSSPATTLQSVTCSPATPVTQTCPTPRHSTDFVLARLTIKRKSRCEGELVIRYHNKRNTPLCFGSEIFTLSGDLCREMGCGEYSIFKTTSKLKIGYILKSNMTLINETNCFGMQINCQDPLGTELIVFKVLTSILILLILGVILLHFSRPAYKTIRKRFSQKRQSRWIGPTQSQSVSYHRGQGPPNNNTVKRQSYPGLERLTVNTSREPSSNRNSDYDSYGFN